MKRNLAGMLVLALVGTVMGMGLAYAQEAAPASHPAKPSPVRTAPTATERPALQKPAAAAPAAVQAAQSAPAAEPAVAQQTPALQTAERNALLEGTYLPTGTTLKITLDANLSTAQNHEGDPFSGHVVEAVAIDGKTIVPVGAVIEGKVARATQPRRIRGTSMIDLRPETIVMPNGTRYHLSAAVVDTGTPKQFDVDEEGRIRPAGSKMKTMRNIGVGAAGGALLGAATVHTPHATVIGAGIGAGAGVVYWLISRHPEQLPANTQLYLELNRPLALTAAAATTQTAAASTGQ